MKKLIIPLLAISIFSCGEKTELGELKNQKKTIESQISELKTSLVDIQTQIDKLDTTKNITLPLITTTIAKTMPFAEKVKFQGTVDADKNVLVSPQSSGTIKTIYVKEGQRVGAGTRLASLDSDILSKNVSELEKSLELANYMLDKQQKLKDQGVGIEVQYEQAKNQKEALEKKLSTLKTQTSKYSIVSPINGYVDEIFPNVGEMGSPQMAMFRVLNLDRVTIKSAISENYLATIKAGSTVSLYFPSLDMTLENLKVTRRGKFINPTNRTFEIEIDVPNQGNKILPNLLAEVLVTKNYTEKALVVPSRSILEDNKGNKYLYTFSNGIVNKQTITVDHVQGDMTQISQGESIKEGDEIVVRGAEEIVDGEEVAVKK